MQLLHDRGLLLALQLAAGVGDEGVGEDGVGLVHDIAAIPAAALRVGRERLGLCPGGADISGFYEAALSSPSSYPAINEPSTIPAMS